MSKSFPKFAIEVGVGLLLVAGAVAMKNILTDGASYMTYEELLSGQKTVETLNGNVVLAFIEECQNDAAKPLDFIIAKPTPNITGKFRLTGFPETGFDAERNILLFALDAKSKEPWKARMISFESAMPGFLERLMGDEDYGVIKGENTL